MKPVDSFTYRLLECGGISALQVRLLKFLSTIQKNISQDSLDLFALLLAKQNDGDTRISVEKEPLIAALQSKMRYLGMDGFEEFRDSIVNGAQPIVQGDYKDIVEEAPDTKAFYQKPFILQNGYLYPSKYYFAKTTVERKVKEIFTSKPYDESELDPCIREIEPASRTMNLNWTHASAKLNPSRIIPRGRESCWSTTRPWPSFAAGKKT